jgi:phospholipase C
VSGDLTSCFDFTRPNLHSLPALPDMSFAKGETLTIDLPPAQPPRNQRMPSQDFGIRFARALPYQLEVHATQNIVTEALDLQFDNHGTAGAVLHVYDRLRLSDPPLRYTLEAGKGLAPALPVRATHGAYDVHILGPNGSLWRLTGRIPQQSGDVALPEVRLNLQPALFSIELESWNAGDRPCELKVTPNAYRGDRPFTQTLLPDAERVKTSWSLQGSGFWYDFNVTCDEVPGWSRRFAGRLETGRHGISDPALGGFTDKC